MVTTIDSEFGPIDIEAAEAQGRGVSNIFNPAIKGKLMGSEEPCIVLALEGEHLMIVNTDGKLAWYASSRVQLDWRYDYKTERWLDASGELLEDEDG
jgi:hypothetical protein